MKKQTNHIHINWLLDVTPVMHTEIIDLINLKEVEEPWSVIYTIIKFEYLTFPHDEIWLSYLY